MSIRSALILIFMLIAFSRAGFAAGREGVSSEIKAESLQGFEDWLHQTKIDLDRNIERIEKTGFNEQERAYRTAIDSILENSKGDVEFLTRNVLYRAQELHDLLKTVPASPKRDAFTRRLLAVSLSEASQLAPLDIDIVRSGEIKNIQGRVERVGFGVTWADAMVNLSYSLPTNESHFIFLKKVMGFLYNDIVEDDRYSRYLANIAAQFLDQYKDLQKTAPSTPLEYLQGIKKLREFLQDEIRLAMETLQQQGSSFNSRTSIPPTESSPLNEQKCTIVNSSIYKGTERVTNAYVYSESLIDHYEHLINYGYCPKPQPLPCSLRITNPQEGFISIFGNSEQIFWAKDMGWTEGNTGGAKHALRQLQDLGYCAKE